MKRIPALLVFLSLFLSSLLSGIYSYQVKHQFIKEEVNRALLVATENHSPKSINADTLCNFRRHIHIAAVRDTAYLTVRNVCVDGVEELRFEANAGCSFLTILGLSDQRLSVAFALLSVLWLISFSYYDRCRNKAKSLLLPVSSMSVGHLCQDSNASRYLLDNGTEIRFTPMQHQLLELFFKAESHCLSKTEICETLWPGKPDASETLYALISRLKAPLEKKCGLTIVSDRGRAYRLKEKD